MPKHVYLAYKTYEGEMDLVGVYTSFDLAKAGLNREINHFHNFENYTWDQERRRYEGMPAVEHSFFIHKQILNQDRFVKG